MTQAPIKFGVLLAIVASCEPPKWIPPDHQCPGELRPVWLANPNYSMCVVTSFRTRDLRTWSRENAGSPSDILTIQADAGQTQLALTGGWPPRLTEIDSAMVVDSVESRTDSTAGIVSHTEVRRRAHRDTSSPIIFVSGLQTADGRYMVASGKTASAATLDTLLIMFRTIRRVPAPNPNSQ